MIFDSFISKGFRTILVAFLILMTQSVTLIAQDPVFLIDLRVTDSDVNKKLEEAKVTVMEDGKRSEIYYSDIKGRVPMFQIALNHIYLLKISKKGYVTKVAEVDTRTKSPELLGDETIQPMEVGLFGKEKGKKFGFLKKEPMIKFYIDEDGVMKFDQEYTKQMLLKIEKIRG